MSPATSMLRAMGTHSRKDEPSGAVSEVVLEFLDLARRIWTTALEVARAAAVGSATME